MEKSGSLSNREVTEPLDLKDQTGKRQQIPPLLDQGIDKVGADGLEPQAESSQDLSENSALSAFLSSLRFEKRNVLDELPLDLDIGRQSLLCACCNDK
jgi:hypothetical protein